MRVPQRLLAADAAVRTIPLFMYILQNLTVLLNMTTEIDRYMDHRTVPQLNETEKFDFIVVGSGSSGSVIARELSKHFRVLLLEAGGNPSPLLSIPIWSYMMSNQPPVDYQYRTVPQKSAAFGLNENVSYWASGIGLGGSSLINGLIFIRGNTQGFDLIANKTQDSIWSLKNILKHYRAMEDYHGFYDDGFSHGKNGEVSIESTKLSPFINNLMEAGKELGYSKRDPNAYGPLTEGFSPMDFYLKSGRRHDAFSGSILPVLPRDNLVIRKFSFVTKILFNKTSAHGVQYERHGETLKAFVTKEVILSAGSIRSAQLLLLSGIGPKEHLKKLKIPVLVDLPVGKRLEDKYGALVGPFTVRKGSSFQIERDVSMASVVRWFLRGKGILAAGRSEATHHIITDYAKKKGRYEVPDVHTYVIALTPSEMSQAAFESALNFNPNSVSYFNLVNGQDAFFQFVTLSRPYGHGYLELADTNPHTHPIIDPQYLQDPRDVKTLIEGIKFSVSVVEKTSAFKEIDGTLMNVSYPGCEKHLFKSDSYYECVGRHATITAYKYSGTAPIGKDSSDPHAVVDSKLRVFGTTGLRVVDSSVLQVSLISVNDVTCRMLGKLAGEIINEFWRK